jgi:hypothetical protein
VPPPAPALAATCPLCGRWTVPSCRSFCRISAGRRQACRQPWSSATSASWTLSCHACPPSRVRQAVGAPTPRSRARRAASAFIGHDAPACLPASFPACCLNLLCLLRLSRPLPRLMQASLRRVLAHLPDRLAQRLGKLAGVQDLSGATEKLSREPIFCMETGTARGWYCLGVLLPPSVWHCQQTQLHPMLLPTCLHPAPCPACPARLLQRYGCSTGCACRTARRTK